MEEVLNIKYKRVTRGNRYYYTNNSKYIVIQYADDFIVLCKTLEDAKAVYGLLDDYLQERGLTLAPDKTKITNLYDGFDFVGYNIRCYKSQDRDRVLIRASKDSIKSFMSKTRDIIRNCYPWNIEESITHLNYLINGTGNYWRRGSNKRLFSKMDRYIVKLWIKQIKKWYPKKSTKWMVRKHFKESLHPGYHDMWTFTDPKTNKQVDKMS